MEFLEITKEQYVGGHKIHLWFNNNVDRVVDFSDKLKGTAFEPLRDLAFFKNFHIAYNTIELANGADFAPEYLLNC
jgi:hypothetical protein